MHSSMREWFLFCNNWRIDIFLELVHTLSSQLRLAWWEHLRLKLYLCGRLLWNFRWPLPTLPHRHLQAGRGRCHRVHAVPDCRTVVTDAERGRVGLHDGPRGLNRGGGVSNFASPTFWGEQV